MKKKTIISLFTTCLLANSIVGCSSQSSTSDTLTVGINATMNGVFSPLYYESVYDGYAIDLIYQGLLAYDVNQKLQCELAKEMPTVSQDGLTYTFKLKKDIQFSDGTPLDANDVKYTFTILSDPSYTGRFSDYASNIVGYEEYNQQDAEELTGVEVKDDQTVVFHLKKPRIDMLATLGTMPICSNEQFDYTKGNTAEIETNTNQPIGSGAYTLNSFDKAVGASFVRNKNFKADKDTYRINKVVIKHTETSTELDELKSGTVDLLPQVSDAGKISSASSDSNLTYNTAPGNSIGFCFFNTTSGPTADKAVRQALAYATDRKSFSDNYFQYNEDASEEVKKEKLAYIPSVFGNPMSEDLGNVIRGDRDIEGLNTYEFSIDKANAILDQAGWKRNEDGFRYKNGQQLVIRIMNAEGSKAMETLVPIITRDWKKIGVNLKQTIIDFNTMLSTVGNDEELGNWETAVLANAFNDLSNNDLNGFYQTGNLNNYARVSNPNLDQYLKQGTYTSDLDESTKNFEKAIVIANDEAGYLPLYGANSFTLYNKRIKNLKTNSFYDWSDAIGSAYIE